MILTIKGTGTKAGEVPDNLDNTISYIRKVEDFLWKIPDVETLKPLSRENCYLLINKPIGGMNYYVTVASALQIEPTPDGLVITPLDFDHEKVKSEHQVLKSFVSGYTKLSGQGDRTSIDFSLTINIDFPMPGALRFVPQGLVQSTADGIMSLRMNMIVDALYQKVLADFSMTV